LPWVRSDSGNSHQNTRKHSQRTRSGYQPRGGPGHRDEDDERYPGQRQPEQRQPGVGAPVRGRHQHLQAMPAEQQPMNADRGDEQNRCAHRTSHRRQIRRPHLLIENVEPLLERERQEEPGEQLHAGLHHPEFLQQAGPVAVEPLGFGLAALIAIPSLVVFRVVDIHVRDHRTERGARRLWGAP
jgi:hypothetical protein